MLPPTVTKVVPVTCVFCKQDMSFTIEYYEEDYRRWMLECTVCDYSEESQFQHRHHLWMNNETVYIGSYWVADD